jgi:hypothetical protein
VTELLQVHDGNYVVRALVQVSGTTLITGMAAAPQIESAEDQAMLRSLSLLGIQPELAPFPVPAIQPLPTFPAVVGETAPFAQTTITPPIPSLDSEATFSPISSEVEESTLPASPLPTISESSLATSDIESDSPAEVESLKSISTPTTPVTAPTSRSKSRNQPKAVTQIAETIAEPTPPINEPVDFSDPIAQIDTEMMRVGWSKEQGRDYLKTTYKKRSRQQLSDDELLDFLSYLQSLPSAIETPF